MAKLKDGTRVYGGLTVDDALLVTDVTISGNLIIQGTTTTVDSTVTQIEDPVLELGSGANGATLTTNDGKERGLSMHYYSGSAKNAFMGWHTTDGEFVLASEVTVSDNDVSTITSYGNVHAGHFIGEGDTLANISGANVTGTVLNANMAAYAGNVVNATQSNITSVGTLVNLTVGNSTANTVFGNGTITTSGEANLNSLVTVGDANIGGNLNVTGNITGTFTGTIAAKGSDKYVQFNDGGNVNGVAGLTFDKSGNALTATGTITGGNLSTGGTLSVSGNVDVNTGKATITASSGDIYTQGAITADGEILANTTLKVTGTANVGNLVSPGSANITGNVDAGNLVTLGGVYGNVGTFTGNASAANISTTGVVTATGDITGGNLITGGGANVTGTANVGNLVSPGSANITGNIDGANLNTTGVVSATGNVTGGNLVTSGTANIGNLAISGVVTGDLIPATNEGGNLGNSTNRWKDLWISGSSIQLGQQTISSNSTTVSVTSDLAANNIVITNNANVGNLNASGKVVGANVTANNLVSTRVTFAGTGGLLTDDANLTFTTGTGELSATLLKGTLTTAAQPNVTSVGTLTSLDVSGMSNVADILIDGDANITGNVNIGGVVIANGEITAASFNTAGHVSATGDFDGANASFTGTLSAGDTTINGNLTVTGTTTSVNTTVTQLTDPLFELGGGANGASLGTADGMDRGLLLHRYDGGAVDSFIGWDEANAQFVVGSNVSVSNNVVTVNEYGDWKAGNATFTGNIQGENLNIGGVIIANGNITSNGYFTGNLVGDVIGNISGNIKVAGGNGSIQFATNVSEHVGSGLPASTIVSGKEYEIITPGTTDFTTVGAANNNVGTRFTATGTPSPAGTGTAGIVSTYGDLSNDGSNLTYDTANGVFTVSGNIAAGGIKTDNYYYANGTAVDFQQAAGNTGELQFNSGDDFTASANLTFDDSTQELSVTGKVIASNVTVSSLTSGTLTIAGTGGALENATGLTYSGTTLTTGNANVTSTLNSGNIKVSSLTAGKVVLAGTDGLLTQDSELSYDSATNTLTANNINSTEKVSAANVAASSLTAGRVTFAGAAGLLVDNGNLTYDGPTNVLSVTGGNVSANYINGSYVTGNGSALSSITGANVTGQVGNALIAGTVYTNAQPNITSVGTLTSLEVSGTTDLGDVGNVTITGGTNGAYLKTDGSGGLSWATVDTSTVANGTSNVSIPVADGNVLIVSGGNTVLTVTGLGANVTGYIDVTGDINANNITANGTLSALGNVDANSSITGTLTVTGGIGATGNIYTGHSVGFANNNGGTASAAYIQFNATANSLDFIFN
jgi:hypothetical protein